MGRRIGVLAGGGKANGRRRRSAVTVLAHGLLEVNVRFAGSR
jgi:hypothetical protein